eukprot:UN31629
MGRPAYTLCFVLFILYLIIAIGYYCIFYNIHKIIETYRESYEENKLQTGITMDIRCQVQVTDDILVNLQQDLMIRPGEITMMVGKSGVGKTSLLNAICGISPERYALSGTIKMGNDVDNMKEVLKSPDIRRNYISIMYQEDNLIAYYEDFSVYEVVYWETFGLITPEKI